MSKNVFVKVILDTRREKKDGLYPLKLRVTFQQKSRYYSLSRALSKEDYQKAMGKAPRNTHKEIQKLIIKTEEKAISIIDGIEEFGFDEFKYSYKGENRRHPSDVNKTIENTIDKLLNQDRIKTASSYSSLLSSLKAYYPKEKLSFSQVTIRFLEDYEQWMLSNGKSTTTIGIYLRNLRALYNNAIEQGVVELKSYPFGKRKYQIPTGNNTKKALSIEEILLIANFRTSNTKYFFARDLWLFSYLANGANIVDILSLRDDNLQDGFIVFQRKKTIRTTRLNPIYIRVFVTKRMQEIIDYWKPQNSNYIFPVLEDGMDENEKVIRTAYTIKFINKYMSLVAENIKLKKHVTTYSARHSFSTVLKRSGASIAFISESLGHKSIATTAYYLDSFEDTEKKKWSEKLL